MEGLRAALRYHAPPGACGTAKPREPTAASPGDR